MLVFLGIIFPASCHVHTDAVEKGDLENSHSTVFTIHFELSFVVHKPKAFYKDKMYLVNSRVEPSMRNCQRPEQTRSSDGENLDDIVALRLTLR